MRLGLIATSIFCMHFSMTPIAKEDSGRKGLETEIENLKAKIVELQNQINDIELIPGPEGPQGIQGPPGETPDLSPLVEALARIEARLSNSDFDADGYTPNSGDCDDSNSEINPGFGDEPGDEVDSNCDGVDGIANNGGSSAVYEGFIDDMLGAHNGVRANAIPVPNPPLSSLSWDPELAALAQTHAEKCIFEFDTTSISSLLIGQNIAAGGNSALSLFQLWADTASDYDYENDECNEGGLCGYYTQLVWRDTSSIGCGLSLCNEFQGSVTPPGFFLVCNYDKIRQVGQPY
ncbi:CAP domain-containing protein [uncultured Microbulbifer sp.]|uniref:CAP domain-containing protein n=1 Tax=uncultured Microbulbifer sp. TaxID=348147 RepID=UPI0025E0A2FA|nr:CAP domain-containing protein [uncultured Microbulbifer sp.]